MHRIGVFGASFNPPTRGHIDVINQAIPHFDEILLVPSIAHAFEKDLLPIEQRLDMLKMLASDKVKIFNVEASLQAGQPEKTKVYTFDVLLELDKYYSEKLKSFSLSFIMGPDNADPSVWKKFYRFEEIEKRWNIFIAKQNIPIRSTSVRDLLSTHTLNEPALRIALIQMVSEPVAEYILQHKLYRKDVNHG